jgi:hypothetical protein
MTGMLDGGWGQRVLSASRSGFIAAVFPPRVDRSSATARWPDPDDPATAGCFEWLLGDHADVVWWDPEFSSTGNWLMSLDGDGCDAFESVGRARIAAAKAIGYWPGGAE